MEIRETHANHPDAIRLVNELSVILEELTGASGKNSFDPDDTYLPRALFVVAYNEKQEAIGCGAIRPLTQEIAEVKRMYAKSRTQGVGTKILSYLEIQAQRYGYTYLRLETRLINTQAVSFYEKSGYHRIPNYGKYKNKSEAVCFEKCIL
jgi:ribosomal protein S18 acetylase RimI-like enzyme